jgi:type II secretory pathway predicted ATPase ExeA
MEHLYQRHFRLTQAPFNITPDPRFLYLSESHREALAQLQYGIDARRGFIVLTGEVGTGKTTLIHTLLGRIGEGTHSALIFSAITSPLELLRYVCEEFKLVDPLAQIRDTHEYIALLNDFLLQRYRAGENAALIIDEAQNLAADVLESIRLLSNFETTKDKLLQILLVGQPELNDRLNTPQLRQLKQRVTLRHHLRPLSLSECQEYISSRLKLAGGNPDLFTPKAIAEIYRYAGGIPRLINVICDNAMINAYAIDQFLIEPLLIQEVAADLNLFVSAARPSLVRHEVAQKFESRVLPRREAPKPHAVQAMNGNRNITVAEPANGLSTVTVVPAMFFSFLREVLIDAMGPMAQIVLTEQVKLSGASLDRFPVDKVSGLIDAVSREIFEESTRVRFRQAMSEKLAMLQRA